MDQFLAIVEADPEYQAKEGLDKKKRGWNVLGDQLVTQLAPRFHKQKPFDPSRDKNDQIVEWMESNSDLNPETDANSVMAGYLGIHFVQ